MEIKKQAEETRSKVIDLNKFIEMSLLVAPKDYNKIQITTKTYSQKESLYIAALHVLLFKFEWGFRSKIFLPAYKKKGSTNNQGYGTISSENLKYNSEWSCQHQISLIDSIMMKRTDGKCLNETISSDIDIRAGIITETENRISEGSNELDIVIEIIGEGEGIKLNFYLSKNVFDIKMADAFSKGYRFVLHQMIFVPNMRLKEIEVVPNKSRFHILNDFCSGRRTYINDESIAQIFKKCVDKYGNKVAATECLDLNMIERQFLGGKILKQQFENCCFKQNKYIIIRQIHQNKAFFVLKSKNNNTLLVNKSVIDLLSLCLGNLSLAEIYYGIDKNVCFVIAEIHIEEPELIKGCWDTEGYEKAANSFDNFIEIIRVLLQNSIIELDSIKDYKVNGEEQNHPQILPCINTPGVKELMKTLKIREKCDILLLGDKPGSCSVGVLYLASYLERHGINVSCQIYDNNWDENSLIKNIVTLLVETRPKFVGISMKWFPHIARCIEICKMIKEYDSKIQTILGGDTASLFCDEIIKNPNVDYIINGDGEYPLLTICRGDETPPNCTWKRNGKILKSSISYHKDENNDYEIFLSNLENSIISNISLYFAPFYIHTHKICSMNCFYCGGRREITEKTFKSRYNNWRKPEQVRNDILLIKDKAPILMFEFGYAPNHVIEYCREIWKDINLSDNYASVYCLSLPDKEFLDLVSNTFKYVRWNLDICSLSEKHREKLMKNLSVKPLPNKEDILYFLDETSQFDNIEVEINLIASLPFYSQEDSKESEEFLEYIMEKYGNICELTWGGYYSEPGTMESGKCKKLKMVSGSNDFDMYIYLSYKNYNAKPYYPVLKEYNFPYIFYEDTNKNIMMSEHYKRLNQIYNNKKQINKERIVEYNSITYCQLDKYSDTLASNIASHYSSISLLIIMAKDKIKLTIAIIAAIKSGIPYMAIDSEYPSQRIRHVSKIVDNALFLTDEFTEKNSEVFTKAESFDALMNDTVELVKVETSADDKLYFMLTSGSTGVPKGVYIRQKGIINYINWRNRKYHYNDDDITLQLLSESFDGFYSNFFSSILSGGKLIFLKSGYRKDMKLASNVIQKSGVTTMSLVPSVYKRLMDFSCKEKFSKIRLIIFGGEKITSDIIENTRNLSEDIVLVNEYGMTENSITSSSLVGVVPSNLNNIGYPIDNTSFFIVNEDNNIMPPGMPGEICVSGIGLTDGYFGRHEINAAKFIDNPYNKGERLYKTGDIGMLQPDGGFAYLNRKDTQLNIHGYRLEPGEIEYYIKQNDEINSVHVMQEGMELVAHITVNDKVNVAVLKDNLRKKIPDYMIPSRFYIMNETDLEQKDFYFSDKEKEVSMYNPDESNKEVVNCIVELWKEALGINKIDRNAHFFDIGGDSMSLLKIYAQLEQKFPGLLTLPDLFSYTTVNELADYLKNQIKNK